MSNTLHLSPGLRHTGVTLHAKLCLQFFLLISFASIPIRLARRATMSTAHLEHSFLKGVQGGTRLHANSTNLSAFSASILNNTSKGFPAQRRLMDTNDDSDGWAKDGTIRPEVGGPGNVGRYQGDSIGDGTSYGDQYTGSLLAKSVGGDVYGWGLNSYGQLGDGFRDNWNIPILSPVLRNKNATYVAAGAEHSIAVSKEGAVFAWGRNQHGQLGLSNSDRSSCSGKALQSNCDGPAPDLMVYPTGLSELWGEHVLQVSSRWDHNLAVTRSGKTYAWGRNNYGQLGTGDTADRNIPSQIKVASNVRFTRVSAGGLHSLGVTAWGEIYVWGSGTFGQLGQDTAGLGPRSTLSRRSLEPITIPGLVGKYIVDISAGWKHCLCVTREGEAYGWGGNMYGQLGLGDNEDRFEPILLQSVHQGYGFITGVVIGVAAGHGHSIWLNKTGFVHTAGRNDAGQLGVGNSIDRNYVSYVEIPQRVWCDTPFGSEVSASYQDWVCVGSMVRDQCGQRCKGIPQRLDCGAKNATLGLQEVDCEPLMPIQTEGLEVHASQYNSYVISRDRNLYAWGSNTFGQVGIGPPELWGRFVTKPKLVVSMYGKNVSSVDGGREHSVARGDREVMMVVQFSPASGPVSGGTATYIIGQGFNTFGGELTCRFSYYTNGTHTSTRANLVNGTLEELKVPAERYSAVRLRCTTPDVRFKDEDGEVDIDAMAQFSSTLETPRNVTVWWNDQLQLQHPSFQFVYVALPGITGVVPKAGPKEGGTYLLVTGYGFDPSIASDVRIRFGDFGNNWMRGCIISDRQLVTVVPPSGPSNSGLMDHDGACNDLCPGDPEGCACADIFDTSSTCVKGIVRASIDPRNRASRTDRCTDCPLVIGEVTVRLSLNGADYGEIGAPFTYFDIPTIKPGLATPGFATPHISGVQNRTEPYGGPDTGGTTVQFSGLGFSVVGLGQTVCMFGCSYTNQEDSVGPKCTVESARHSVTYSGEFRGPNLFVFTGEAPERVWDLIHFGTRFMCHGGYNGTSGCPAYNRSTGEYVFYPPYEPLFTPTFRGYNETTEVVTSCIEDCESRAEYIDDNTMACVAPPRLLPAGVFNETVTIRLKLNGQDVFPSCFAEDCSIFEEGATVFTYYKQPTIKRMTPNGGPLLDQSFVFVEGEGFSRFSWFPHCQFGKQTVVQTGNSTIFTGWLSNHFRTNSSAYILNDTHLVCFAPQLPHNAPELLDQEFPSAPPGWTAQKGGMQKWVAHHYILGSLFPGRDGDPFSSEDNFIEPSHLYAGNVDIPFTISLNSQDWVDADPSLNWPYNPPPGTRVSSKTLRWTYYPHPDLRGSTPLGGPGSGRTQIVIDGFGFSAYNEMSEWRGQLDPENRYVNCTDSEGFLTPALCSIPLVNKGTSNPNWFNDTTSTPRPPFVTSDVLGWPAGDKNVGQFYSYPTTTSIKCRFGSDRVNGHRTYTVDPWWGVLERYEPIYLKSVYADYLSNGQLRCRAPDNNQGLRFVQISLNGRDYSNRTALHYVYYNDPHTFRLKPSGGPIEGHSTVTVFGEGFTRYDSKILCRFGSETLYNPLVDRDLAWPNITTPGLVLDDSTIICQSVKRHFAINAPFGISLNGQDFNLQFGMCDVRQNGSEVMWDNPLRPEMIIPNRIAYSDTDAQISDNETLTNGCPFVFYNHPIGHALVPAGGPMRGKVGVRVFGRGYNIFAEDVRCKFGADTGMWSRADDRPLTSIFPGIRDDEINCLAPPHIVLTLSGPGVACTFDCVRYPLSREFCNYERCSFNATRRNMAFKLAIAEVVGTRDIFGDINVFPRDVIIDNFQQPLSTEFDPERRRIDVSLCVNCPIGEITDSNVEDSLKIIDAVRTGVLLDEIRRYGIDDITEVEVTGQAVPLMVTLNGQDYTYKANSFFSFYLSPEILGLNPRGAPLIRYETAEFDHKNPTTVEIAGAGFRNYDEKPQCAFGEEIVPATVDGDRLLFCQTPWPRVLFPANCKGSSCVLDVWVEISLNGQDFTTLGSVNFRYYEQPDFGTFSPMGGPTEGGTLVTFRGKGFNRFNDGSLRFLWGLKRFWAEELQGGLVLEDDFDPIPAETEPLPEEYNLITDDSSNETRKVPLLATDYAGAWAILRERYAFDDMQWDFESAVDSSDNCGGMDLKSQTAKVDVGYLPGDTATDRQEITSSSLNFNGKSSGLLSGRYLISRSMDLSLGYSYTLWLKRGSQTAPELCETPDPRDELALFTKMESGLLFFDSTCLSGCTDAPSVRFSFCNATWRALLTHPGGYLVNRTIDYPALSKVVWFLEYVDPLCQAESMLATSTAQSTHLQFVDDTDTRWLRMETDVLMSDKMETIKIIFPVDKFIAPQRGEENMFHFQKCVCLPVTTCDKPPCDDNCTCSNLPGMGCTLEELSESRYPLTIPKTRTMHCQTPGCPDCSNPTEPSEFQVKVEYVPDMTPPEWQDIDAWKRLSVFDTAQYIDFVLLSRSQMQNERGIRNSENRNELHSDKQRQTMVECPRQQSCRNKKSRLMFKQAIHGQGSFDAWAVDNIEVRRKGGVVSDEEMIAVAPPAHVAIPLTPQQRLAWASTGRLTGKRLKGVNVEIAMNNQTYERAGRKNFCRFQGDQKQDPDDSNKQIVCDRRYFNWDEPEWLFQSNVEKKYTNWYEGLKFSEWAENNPLFQQSQSEQFTYYQHPKLQDLRPSGGPVDGGTAVTVVGSGFSVFSDPLRPAKCKFGNMVTDARVMTDEEVFCTTPPTLFSGYVDVAVSLNEIDFTSPALGQEYAVPYLFYEQPTIAYFDPPTGPSRGGTVINIVGSGFFQLPTRPACRFIGVTDPTVVMDMPGTFLNDTLIQCVSPSVANLCTRSTYCDQANDKDPAWRGCMKWETCPFVGQCEGCACPKSALCRVTETTTIAGEEPVYVERDQVGEDVLFDTVVQLSLNGICCVRDEFGRLTDPCEPCERTNIRCGCVGDFTAVESDQDSNVQNTFTFYREAEMNYQKTIQDNGNRVLQNNAGTPITIVGNYFRNTTRMQCAYKVKCHREDECTLQPPESNADVLYDTFFVKSPEYMFCNAPNIPGQPLSSTGNVDVFVSINGIDHTNSNFDCPPNGCIDVKYRTPESAESYQRRMWAIFISLTVTIVYVYLQRQRYLKKNAKYVADTGGDFEKPSLREAFEWQREHQVRKYGSQYYPLWKTGEAELGQLGVGMGLYFAYLKYMTKYFLAMSLMCIPSLVLNSSGIAYQGRTDVPPYIFVSVGNIGQGWTPSLLNVLCWGNNCAQMESKVVAWVLAIIDCSISLVFLMATWRLKLFQEQTIIAIDEDTITAADYTVLVENIPSDATDPDEFRAFFSRYGEVADVAIGLNNGKLIDLFQKHGKKELAIEEQTAKLKLYKLQSMQKELKAMKKKLHKLDAKIVALRSKQDFRAVCAYVTFNEESGQEECIEAYKHGIIAQLRGKSKTKKFRGKYNVKVTQASEPSNVLWENLQHRGFESVQRSFVANLITAAMLSASLFIVLFVKSLKDSYVVEGGNLVCVSSAPNPDDPKAQEKIRWSRYSASNNQEGEKTYQTYLACYCGPYGKQLDKEPVFCAPYTSNLQRVQGLTLGSVLLVIGINQILEQVLKILAGYEKPHTISAWEKGIARRIFVAQWINTGILVMIVNAALDKYIPELKILRDQGILSGKFRDTTDNWYVTVGGQIVTQSVTAAIAPNAAILAKWPQAFLMQYLLKHRMLTQRKLNRLFEGVEFLLSKRYGSLLNILFVIMTYCSGLPVLYFFGIVFFSTAYLSDKVAILRACKRPAQYDEKLAFFCTSMMSVSLIIHLALATWFFGALDGEAFPIGFLQGRISSWLYKRVSRRPSASVFFFLLGVVSFEIAGRTFGPPLLVFIRHRFFGVDDAPKESNPSFFEALENQEISGLDNYNIKKNPRYRDAFSSDIAGDDAEDEDSEEDDDDDFGADDEEDDDA